MQQPSINRYWPSPWGFEETDKAPSKEFIMDHLNFEDFLQHNAVFVSGLDGRVRHMDSYMTVVDPDALQYCLEVLETTYGLTGEDFKVLSENLVGLNAQFPARFASILINGFSEKRTCNLSNCV